MTLRLIDIGHDYGGPPVLDHVSIAINPGEIHALLGMNGAGKSTLLHMAAGVHRPKRGTTELNGQPVSLRSPADAARQGIVFLTQEVDRGLVPQLSVHENLTVALLLKEKKRYFNKKQNRKKAESILASYGLFIDVDREVKHLSIYEKQMISIIRAVVNDAKYLLLDEPTAALGTKEAKRFYEIIQQLKQQGIGIVFISHKMHEIFEQSDRITVLRGGKVTLHKQTETTTPEATVIAMTGQETKIRHRNHAARQDESGNAAQFTVQNLPVYKGKPSLSLEIGKGEIVTVFGLLGSGKTHLAETLFGLHQTYTPQIDGETTKVNSTSDAVKRGLAFIPEERGRQGIWKREDIKTHLALSFQGVIHDKKEREYGQKLIDSYTIRPSSPDYKVGRLSGGNQQKVAIAKWFAEKRKIALFDEPMKGIDVSARETIFQMIEGLAGEGTSILYFTAEPDEALRISDRILILDQGVITAEINPGTVSLTDLMLAASREEHASGIN